MYCNGYEFGCRAAHLEVQQQPWSGKDALPSLISPKIILNKTCFLFLKSQASWLLSRFFPSGETKQELSSLRRFQGAKLGINYTSLFWLLFSGGTSPICLLNCDISLSQQSPLTSVSLTRYFIHTICYGSCCKSIVSSPALFLTLIVLPPR